MRSLLLTLIIVGSICGQNLMKAEFRDFSHVAISSITVYKNLESKESFTIKPNSTFSILKKQDSYLFVECYSGEKGYIAADEKKYAKLLTLYGRVIRKPWSKTLESWRAGGGAYCILDTSGEPRKQNLPGPFLRPSPKLSFDKISELNGKKAMVIGVADAPKGSKVEPWSQYPMGKDGKPVSRPGSGKGIRVYEIWEMKETRNATAPIQQAQLTKLPNSVKGYELHGWKEQNTWHFCLVTGTNRIKTFEEISKPGQEIEKDWCRIHVVGVDNILETLKKLRKGAQVFWHSENKLPKEIQDFAKTLGIQIFH